MLLLFGASVAVTSQPKILRLFIFCNKFNYRQTVAAPFRLFLPLPLLLFTLLADFFSFDTFISIKKTFGHCSLLNSAFYFYSYSITVKHSNGLQLFHFPCFHFAFCFIKFRHEIQQNLFCNRLPRKFLLCFISPTVTFTTTLNI